MYDTAQSTANAMQQSFSNIFFDSMTGKLQSAGDYFKAFFETILRTLTNVASEMIVKWLLVQAGSLSATSSAVEGIAAESIAVKGLIADYIALAAAKASAGAGGIVTNLISGFGGKGTPAASTGTAAEGASDLVNIIGTVGHSGGIVKDIRSFRIVPSFAFAGAPRYHTGIGPNERAGIFKNDEGIFTAGQMKALGGALNRETPAPVVKLDIANIVSPDLLDAYLATGRGQNAMLNLISSKSGTIRRILGKT
jgi:hypothetical protein